ncbi:MAG: type I phosphomannose isomerase catalytic subunit [Culicoidibacterales bacterium]
MSIVKLSPYYCPKVWGFEEWQFSTHPNGMTKIADTQQQLNAYLKQQLPILIKYIEAKETLSVQVHPNDEYAKQHTDDLGKTECWYITEADPGAKLIFGLKAEFTRAQLTEVIATNQLEAHLAYIEVATGDMVYIPAGTIHAIMGGINLIEIQQSSDTTYRLYDWGRERELHLEDSLAVIDYRGQNGAKKIPAAQFSRLTTPYFTVEKYTVAGELRLNQVTAATVSVVSGQINYQQGKQRMTAELNETLYVEAKTAIELSGFGTILITTWDNANM